jgi:hypothetical protein
MAFKVGQTKQGGRAKGVPNRTTSEFRAILGVFIFNQLNTLPEAFRSIKSPERRLELIIKLLPYVVPKMHDLSLENLSEDKLSAILEILTYDPQ